MPLEDDLLHLAELDRGIVRAIVEADTSTLAALISEYVQERKRIEVALLDEPAAMIQSGDASAVLRKIAGGQGLPSDGAIARLLGTRAPGGLVERIDDEELQQLGEQHFYSWFSHREYIAGLAELRPMVLRSHGSEAVLGLIRQVKGCYAFQQYDAAYSLCRMLIEASIRDICARRQLLPDHGANVVLLERRNWAELRRRVASGQLEIRLKDLYEKLSTVLHARKSVSKDETRRVFHETLEVVEDLYAAHGL